MWECSSGGLHVFIVFEVVIHHQGLGKLSFKRFQEVVKYQERLLFIDVDDSYCFTEVVLIDKLALPTVPGMAFFLNSCFFLSDCYLSNVILVSTCSFNTLSIRPVNAFLRWRMVIMLGVFSMLWTTSMVLEIYTWRSSWDRISVLMCNLLTINDIRSI